jgi:hypothetical protein
MLMMLEIHTPLTLTEVKIAIAKLRKYKSSGSDQIPEELSKARGETLVFVIHRLINSLWIKEELPDQWKESIIVPVNKEGDETDCNNYCRILQLSGLYKILSNIHLSRLSTHIDYIIVDHQSGFRCNRSSVTEIFCMQQIIEEK